MLKLDHLIKRETAARERQRPLVVELHPHYLIIRVKGTHEAHTVAWETILSVGRNMDARIARNMMAGTKP